MQETAETARPTSVTVFGVLNIVFGGWGLLGKLMGLAMKAASGAAANRQAELLARMKEDALYRAWSAVFEPLSFIVPVVLIVAGIGLLKMRQWGRTVSLVYAVYRMITVVLGFLVLQAVMGTIARSIAQGESAEVVMRVMLVAGIAGLVLGLVYPVVLLIFMTRPRMKQAFREAAERRAG